MENQVLDPEQANEFWKLLEIHKFTLQVQINKLTICD